MRVRSLISVVFVALAGSACSGGGPSEEPVVPGCTREQPAGFPIVAEGKEVGDTAVDMQLTDAAGNDVCLRDYTGKVVLINLGAGWCGPCRSETPHIQTVYEEKKDEGFVVLMGMAEDYNGNFPSAGFLNQWQAEFSTTFTLLADPNWSIWVKYGPGGNQISIPYNVFVDRDHVIRYKQAGAFTSTNQIRTRVESYLSQPATLEY